MVKTLLTLTLLCLVALPVSAQQTQTKVTGTIVDPNSVPYYPATVLACLTPAVTNPTVAGAAISTNPGAPYCVGPAQTGLDGTFQIPLYANSVIQCNNVACSTQWQFTVTASGTAPPAGKGAQNFQVVTTISNLTAQDLSVVLTGAAPILLNSGGGGGSVGPGTPQNVGCFSTTTNLQNCPDPITDTPGVGVNIPANLQVGGSGGGGSSIGLPSGPTSGCEAPTVGKNILCADGVNNTFDQSLNGAPYAPIAGTNSVNPGVIGQPTAYTSASTVDNIPLFIAVDAVTGAGIGATPVAWVTGTTYPLCQEVSNGGGNYLAVSTVNGATTPGTDRTKWYAIPNGSRPTQYDCAFYIAQSQVTSTQGINLQLGQGTYNSCIGMTYPLVGSPGLPGVNILGGGPGVSTIKQTCTKLSGSGGDGLAMINVPAAATSFFLPRLIFEGFTLDANGLAWNFDLGACQQCFIRKIDLLNPAFGSDHAFEAGKIGGTSKGWVFELNMEDVALVYNANVTGHGHGNGAAAATVTVAAGVPTITVTNGGVNYDTAQLAIRLVKTGGLEACTVPGTNTATVDGSGTITAVTSTATGCAATGSTFVQFFPGLQVQYGFKFSDMTDSDSISNLDTGVGATCGIYTSNVNGFNVYYKLHPQGTFDGVCANGSETFIGTQIDSVYNAGILIGSQFNQENFYATGFEWNNSHYTGSHDWEIQNVSNPPSGSPAAINTFGEACGNTPQQDAYAHIVAGAGIVDAGSALPPRMVMSGGVMYCDQFTSATTPNFTTTATDVVWSNGKKTNYWDHNLGSGGNATMTLTNTSGSAWTQLWLNPTAATSGANAASPIFEMQGQYWDGSITQPYGPRMRATFAAGTGPLTSFVFDHVGTEPAGGHKWTFDAAVTLPTGSIGTTQSASDNSTKLATTAYTDAAVAAVSGTAGCASGCSYALGVGDSAGGAGGTGSVLGTANQPAFFRFYNPLSRSITKGCFLITTASAGGNADVAVYSVSGTAMTRVWHTGAISTTSTGQQCATATTANLTAGQNYYIAYCADNTTATVAQLLGTSGNISIVMGGAGSTANTYGLDATDVSTGGVCPATATTTNITNNNAKLLATWLQVYN